jgi:DhnA family fructose-bisphosphate aldolase class Ia
MKIEWVMKTGPCGQKDYIVTERIEPGASLVKTYYCEDFQKIISGCPVPW